MSLPKTAEAPEDAKSWAVRHGTTAAWVSDRGGLQTKTFHTMRTYLTLLNKLLHEWGSQFPQPGIATDILKEAQEWLKTGGHTERKSEVLDDVQNEQPERGNEVVDSR